jgi:hypothetical protein
VIAGQRAFGRKCEIGEGDLLLGIHALRQSAATASATSLPRGSAPSKRCPHDLLQS